MGPMKMALAIVFCLLLSTFAFWLWAPSIWADLMLRGGKLERSPHYVIDEARCRTRAFVISVCDITLKPAAGGPGIEFDYLILGKLDGEPVHILAPDTGGQVTTNIGIDYAINRLAMLLAFGGGLLLLSFWGAVRMLRGGR